MPKATRSAAARIRPAPKPLRKSLERAARGLKDDDEFVLHVAAICARYRAAHARDSQAARATLRQSLRIFRKHAAALDRWLEQAQRQHPATIEAQAFGQLSEELQSAQGLIRVQTQTMRDWLSHTERAAGRYLERSVRSRAVPSAPRLTAEALLATFDHHKLKITLGSKRTPGAIVGLLREIAKAAGADLTTEDARAAFTAARAPVHSATA